MPIRRGRVSSDGTLEYELVGGAAAVGGKAGRTKGMRWGQALPLPLTTLLIGVGASVTAWQWLRSPEELKSAFQRDAAAFSYQVASRVKLDVGERSAASFVEWAGSSITIDEWTGFTNDWIENLSQDGFIVWAPRVESGQTSSFHAAARGAYPEIHGGVNITRRSQTGPGFVAIDESTAAIADMWPVLYVNPRNDSALGFDYGSDAARGNAIELMLASNSTAISETMTFSEHSEDSMNYRESVGDGADGIGHPGFLVFQPVFADGNKRGGIIGCTIAKTTRVDDLVMDTLKVTSFAQKYPGADVAVFLRVTHGLGSTDGAVYGDGHASGEDGVEADDDQLLFDLEPVAFELHPKSPGTANNSNPAVTPIMVARRGTSSFTSVVSLTENKAVVMVLSFEPTAKRWTSVAVVVLWCAASLLVAGLVYGRQMLLLRYEDDMEKLAIHSRLKSRFVADLSHEIRTPLNGIIGMGELLAEQKLSQGAVELVSTIQACGRILMGIVSDVLDFSKIEAGELNVQARPVALRTLLPEVMDVMKATYWGPGGELDRDEIGGLTMRMVVSESVPLGKVLADETRIRQVLVNILSNALKFTDSGSVTVTARCQDVASSSDPTERIAKYDNMDSNEQNPPESGPSHHSSLTSVSSSPPTTPLSTPTRLTRETSAEVDATQSAPPLASSAERRGDRPGNCTCGCGGRRFASGGLTLPAPDQSTMKTNPFPFLPDVVPSAVRENFVLQRAPAAKAGFSKRRRAGLDRRIGQEVRRLGGVRRGEKNFNRLEERNGGGDGSGDGDLPLVVRDLAKTTSEGLATISKAVAVPDDESASTWYADALLPAVVARATMRHFRKRIGCWKSGKVLSKKAGDEELGQGSGQKGGVNWNTVLPSFRRDLRLPTHTKALLVVEVADTGVGMTVQQMERLFKPFSQVHGSSRAVGGTGLGLTISKALCRSMGGDIECRSTSGEGSTFRFSALVGIKVSDPGPRTNRSNDRVSAWSSFPFHRGPSRRFGSDKDSSSEDGDNTSSTSEGGTKPLLLSSPYDELDYSTGDGSRGASGSVGGDLESRDSDSLPPLQSTAEWEERRSKRREDVRRGGGGGREGVCIDRKWDLSAAKGTGKRAEFNANSDIKNALTPMSLMLPGRERGQNAPKPYSRVSGTPFSPESESLIPPSILQIGANATHVVIGGGGVEGVGGDCTASLSATTATNEALPIPLRKQALPGAELSSRPFAETPQDLEYLDRSKLQSGPWPTSSDVPAATPDAIEGARWAEAGEVSADSARRSSDEKDGDIRDESIAVTPSTVVTGVKRPRFLVVDDVRINRMLVCKMLEALDVEVEVAEDGFAAVEACQRSRFSLILMDVVMPGIDGLEAARFVRSGDGPNHDTHIIALTATPGLEIPRGGRNVQGKEVGGKLDVTDVLMKPISRKTLFAKIQTWAPVAEAAWMTAAWARHTAVGKPP